MSIWMKGIDVANAMKETLIAKTDQLKENGITPCITIIRVGNRPDDLAYERGAKKKMETIGITCHVMELSEDILQKDLEQIVKKVNDEKNVHGILLFRPLPNHLDEAAIKKILNPAKDIDCMTDVNIAKVFAGDDSGYAPCTAEAVVEMLEYNGIALSGKNVTIVGRSMVVGRPLAMMLLKRNATVTICHTKTEDLVKICREAEILIAAAGSARMITPDMVGDGAVVVDVGINVDEEGNLCGDVDFDHVEKKASYISPVPRGVGSITTSVLAKHVVLAATKQ